MRRDLDDVHLLLTLSTSPLARHTSRAPTSANLDAQDNQLHGPGPAGMGEDDSLRRVSLLEVASRHARPSSAHEAAINSHGTWPARDSTGNSRQHVLQRALLVERRGARSRGHHLRQPRGHSAVDVSGRHGRGRAHAQAARPRPECRESAVLVQGHQRADRRTRRGDGHVRRVQAAARAAAGPAEGSGHQRVSVRGGRDGEPGAVHHPQLDAHLTGMAQLSQSPNVG